MRQSEDEETSREERGEGTCRLRKQTTNIDLKDLERPPRSKLKPERIKNRSGSKDLQLQNKHVTSPIKHKGETKRNKPDSGSMEAAGDSKQNMMIRETCRENEEDLERERN